MQGCPGLVSQISIWKDLYLQGWEGHWRTSSQGDNIDQGISMVPSQVQFPIKRYWLEKASLYPRFWRTSQSEQAVLCWVDQCSDMAQGGYIWFMAGLSLKGLYAKSRRFCLHSRASRGLLTGEDLPRKKCVGRCWDSQKPDVLVSFTF